jgi:hypothetical protein
MKKILVISPSGEVYDHDCVRWYPKEGFDTNPDHYHNIGDAFVFDSSLKLLRFEQHKMLDIRNPTDAMIDRYNNEYEYAFLRGSNYIHRRMDWENAPAVLRRLRIPILAFGIGAQAPITGELELPPAAREVLAIIADHSTSIGVRGSYTADVLRKFGVRNIRIIGCPTVFRSNDPFLRIDLPPLEQVRQVGYTLRREVDSEYAKDVRHYLDVQRETILELSARFNLEILSQGEIEEKAILWGNETQREAAKAVLHEQNWFRGPDDKLEALYDQSLFYSDNVAEFETKLRAQQLVLGFRLHGNLLGLANRVPAIYFTYDSRTTEFVDTFSIPRFDIYGGDPFRLEDYWDQSLFERFNHAYSQRYKEMRLFLDENNVSHKMIAENQVPLGAPARPTAAAEHAP